MKIIERFLNALLGLRPQKVTLRDDLIRIKRGLNKPKPPSNRWY